MAELTNEQIIKYVIYACIALAALIIIFSFIKMVSIPINMIDAAMPQDGIMPK